jgi:hypothetical protein
MNWTGDWTGDRTGTGQGHMARQDRNKATWPDRTGTKRKERRTVSGQTIILTALSSNVRSWASSAFSSHSIEDNRGLNRVVWDCKSKGIEVTRGLLLDIR